MKASEYIEACLKGGPGLSGYSFKADTYCEDCTEKIVREHAAKVAPEIEDTDDPLFMDSETVPQPVFFGEHEIEQRCAECDEYLYGGDLA